MRVCVTGAAGRLGSETVRALAAAGHEVVAVDRQYRGDLPVPLEVVDLCEPLGIRRAITGCAALVHLGNHPNPNTAEPERLYRENCAMNAHAFEAARQVGVRQVLFASSIQVVSGHTGTFDEQPIDLAYLPLDGALPPRPANCYAASKVAGEVLLEMYARKLGLAAVTLRFPLLGDRNWLTKPHRHNRRGWFLNPNEAMAFLWVDDAARLIAALLARPIPGYRCYLPADPTPWGGHDVPQLLRDYYAHVPQRRPLTDSLVDLTALRNDCGWNPTPTDPAAFHAAAALAQRDPQQHQQRQQHQQ